jgi:predicted RND superfamily exporter protein
MFQYISDIIKNISPQQRLWALVVVLVTVVVVTLGDNLITAFTNSDNVLENKISRLESANQLLNNQNRELQTIVIESQLQCTKDITNLRQQIVDELSQIEREMRMTQRPMMTITNDTVVMSQPVPAPVTSSPAMSHIRSMKKQLENDIEKSK